MLRFRFFRPNEMNMQNDLQDRFARVLAELSAILMQDTQAPDASAPDGCCSLEPAVRSRDALEEYLHEMRKSEAQSHQMTPRLKDRQAA
jgi:hypothetical protein